MGNQEIVENSDPADSGGTPKTEGTTNGSKARSETQYPYFGLSRGIEIVEAVRRAGGNEAPNADVMREMSVTKTTDRYWAYGIPAATQFGLIERVGRGGEGHIKITELGLRIALPGTNDEARAAKVAAFRKPELYEKLLEKFSGHPEPTKDGLKNILHRDYKILESMAPIAADAFLDSLKVAELLTPSGVIAALNGLSREREKQKSDKAEEQKVGDTDGARTQTIKVPADFIIYRCKIGKGRIIEIPLPPDFKMADVKRLYAFLKTQVDDEEIEDDAEND